VLVDLKSDDPAHAAVLVDLLRASERPPEGWYVSAKDPAALAVVIEAGYRGWLSLATRPAFTGAMAGHVPAGLAAVTVRHTYLDRATVGRLREHVPAVMAWTVNKLYRAEELSDLRIDGLTSDDASVWAYAAARSG
jgi:hypothetical protein